MRLLPQIGENQLALRLATPVEGRLEPPTSLPPIEACPEALEGSVLKPVLVHATTRAG